MRSPGLISRPTALLVADLPAHDVSRGAKSTLSEVGTCEDCVGHDRIPFTHPVVSAGEERPPARPEVLPLEVELILTERSDFATGEVEADVALPPGVGAGDPRLGAVFDGGVVTTFTNGVPARVSVARSAAGTWVLRGDPDELYFLFDFGRRATVTVHADATCDDGISSCRVLGAASRRAGDRLPAALPIAPRGGDYQDSTASLRDDYHPSCISPYAAGGKDIVYTITLAETSELRLDTRGSEFDTVLSVAPYDPLTGAIGADLGCNDDADPYNGVRTSVLRIPNVAPGTYAVVVDGYTSASAGALSLHVRALTHDDHVSEARELPVTGGVFLADTTAFADDLQPTCAWAGGGGRDAIFRLTLAERRRVHLTTAGSTLTPPGGVARQADTVLYVRRTDGVEMACNDDSGGTLASTVDVTLDPGTYLVVLDGYTSAEASDTMLLDATLTPP
jgi:hypothetical protein